MRIAYVCPDPGVPVFGTKGSSVHVRELVRTMRRHGHEVVLYCLRRGGEAPPDLADVAVTELPLPRTAAGLERELAIRDRVRQLQQRVVADGPWDLVHERYALWSAGAADRGPDGPPSVLEVNAPLPEEAARHRGLVQREQAEAVTRAALAGADVVSAVSDPVADWCRRSGAAPQAVLTVPNGVDVHRIRPVVRRAGPGWTLGFTGTFRPWHGTGTLVEAFAVLARRDAGVRLLMVGDGPQLPAVRQRVAELGLEPRVELTGALPHEEVVASLGRMDVAVAPYDDPGQDYFSPLKVFEYLAAGLPVVASDVGQLRELLTPGGRPAGCLTAPGDVDALVRGCELARRQAAAWGVRGRQLAVERHSWDGVWSRLQQALPLGAAR
ncbi:glycosyltransferase [Auraticoccus sp. F435]|uniref:Glycosyltransferase n=1 Tax=Auraticoccus cholistanensis TaxID=2656650 RepID=A0A6A9V1N9_9ACTN|nr:glycosyltransferase [Auraticoccus cholistanensis]